MTIIFDAVDVDGTEAMAGESLDPSSRRRLIPRVELSLRPSAVALIRIWCLSRTYQLMHRKGNEQTSIANLVRLIPHSCITASQLISPVVFDRCSSAIFFKRSVSSSDHDPWLPTAVPPVAGVVVIRAVGCVVTVVAVVV